VRHKGVDHRMRVLDVDAFIAQQKKAREAEIAAEAAQSVDEDDMLAVVTMVRDSVSEFFPTLPVGELPTDKLFQIFTWLNELSAKINEASVPSGEGVEETVDAAGNAQS
jgi:hypothetical protein